MSHPNIHSVTPRIRRVFRVLSCLVLLLRIGSGELRAGGAYFDNPLDVLIADPHVLKDGDTYYLYGTTGSNFETWSSTDLVNWQYRGVIFQPTAASWGKNRFWAPEVAKKGSNYYLFYSAGGSPNNVMRICVAASASPMGPFVDVAAPLFDDGQSWIDGHVFTDKDGISYLYCSQDMSHPADNKSETYVARLNSTFTGLDSALTLCVTPTATWEINNGGLRWTEAPAVIKHAGYYYLLFSGNLYSSSEYAVGYATATSPTGPWTKYAGNPVLKKTVSVSGPGHCSVVASPDGTQQWMVYHTHQQMTGGNARHLAMDRIQFSTPVSGPPVLSAPAGPSRTPISAPAGGTPFPVGGSDDFSGVTLDRSKWTVFSENPAKYTVAGGSLNLTLEPGDTYGAASSMRNIFLQYPPWSDFRITAKLQFSPQQNTELAFVTVWQDHNNYLRFADVHALWQRFEFGSETNSVFTGEFAANTMGPVKFMRVTKIGNLYSCHASEDGITWTQIGASKELNFSDIKVGFGAASPGSNAGRVAQFDSFTIQPIITAAIDWQLY